jgi:hypothetical protein
MSAAKHALRYLRRSPNIGITYGAGKGVLEGLHGYSDSDYARCVETRRLTIRYLFNYYSRAISFRSKRLQVVALSLTETEYYALSNVAREAAWLRQLFYELGVDLEDVKTIRIYGDNQGSLALTDNLVIY